MKFEFGRDVEVPLSPCPTCGHQMDRATCTTGDHAPKFGDLTVCISCLTVLQFGPSLRLIALADSDLDAPLLEHIETLRAGMRKVLGKEIN
jgi:hypothetical protein